MAKSLVSYEIFKHVPTGTDFTWNMLVNRLRCHEVWEGGMALDPSDVADSLREYLDDLESSIFVARDILNNQFPKD